MLNLMENSYDTNISRENPFDNLDFFLVSRKINFSRRLKFALTDRVFSAMQKQHAISIREMTCKTAMPVLDKR